MIMSGTLNLYKVFLKEVDLVNENITIKQYFTYYNFLHKLETESKIRVFKNNEFFMISCGNMTAK